MAPSRELSEAVMLAVAFAERGSLPEQEFVPCSIVGQPVPTVEPFLTASDFARLEPRILADLFALYNAARRR